jgi:hypothetical protein
MYALGLSDGSRDNVNCTNSAVVLDFGQVKYQAGGPYGGYGVSAFTGFYTDATVVLATRRYAAGWYNSTGSCPRLKIIIGVNNVYQCPSGGSCDPYVAGKKWGSVVNNVQTWLNNNNYSWQITAWGGDDMEQPDGVTPWDCATKTRKFVDGFNDWNPSGALFIDFGTAWVPVPNCWAASDVYYVAWSAGWEEYPQPEIYKQSALNSWINLAIVWFTMVC